MFAQRSEQEQFLFETTVEATVKDTVVLLAEVHNLRAKIAVMKIEAEELAKYGPAKPLDKQGIDEYSEAPVDKGPHYTMDPTGRRTGNGVCPMRMREHSAQHWIPAFSTRAAASSTECRALYAGNQQHGGLLLCSMCP